MLIAFWHSANTHWADTVKKQKQLNLVEWILKPENGGMDFSLSPVPLENTVILGRHIKTVSVNFKTNTIPMWEFRKGKRLEKILKDFVRDSWVLKNG